MSRYAQDLQGNLILIAGNSDYDVIAPKETSPATAPHTKGSRIFYGNALYEVIADIAVNDALVIGTNITASDDITDLIEGKVDKTDLTSIIATGTTNTTGSPITTGKYFYLNGKIVRATATITNNEAFTLNTNYEELPDSVLNNINPVTEYIDLNIQGISLYKYGNVVQLVINKTISESTGGKWLTLGILPQYLRPKVQLNGCGYDNGGSTYADAQVIASRILASDGSISVYVFNDHKSFDFRCEMTYLI